MFLIYHFSRTSVWLLLMLRMRGGHSLCSGSFFYVWNCFRRDVQRTEGREGPHTEKYECFASMKVACACMTSDLGVVKCLVLDFLLHREYEKNVSARTEVQLKEIQRNVGHGF